MTAFESRLSSALNQSSNESRPVVYLAAVSGGADSTAMLAGMAALRQEAGFTLHCIHVEHGIRPSEESKGDARAVEALCEKFKVPCKVVTIPEGRIAAFAGKGGPGIEGAARIFRHRAFNAERRRLGADWILTAHTMDDLLENLLMRILKGAGPAGLATMPKSRGRVLRPILEMTRQDVLGYLEEKGIQYRTDATNADIRYFRNRVRVKLIPLLDSMFPYWRKTALALAETQAMTAEFLAAESARRLPWVSEDGLLKLGEEDFFKAPPILREEALFAAADMLAERGLVRKSRKTVPRRAVVRNAARLMQTPADLGPIRIEHEKGFVYMSPGSAGETGFSLLIKEPGLYTLKGRVLGLDKNTELTIKVCTGDAQSALYSKLSATLPLVFRKHRVGDRIRRGGHKRRLSGILNSGVRPSCTGVITVCDAEGPYAFIVTGKNVTVITGDGAGPGAGESAKTDRFFFEFGGLDV